HPADSVILVLYADPVFQVALVSFFEEHRSRLLYALKLVRIHIHGARRRGVRVSEVLMHVFARGTHAHAAGAAGCRRNKPHGFHRKLRVTLYQLTNMDEYATLVVAQPGAVPAFIVADVGGQHFAFAAILFQIWKAGECDIVESIEELAENTAVRYLRGG